MATTEAGGSESWLMLDTVSRGEFNGHGQGACQHVRKPATLHFLEVCFTLSSLSRQGFCSEQLSAILARPAPLQYGASLERLAPNGSSTHLGLGNHLLLCRILSLGS